MTGSDMQGSAQIRPPLRIVLAIVTRQIVPKLSNDDVICTAAAPQRSMTNDALEAAPPAHSAKF